MLNQTQEPDLSLASEASRPMNVLVLDDLEVDRRRLLRLCETAGLNIVGTEAATIGDMQAAMNKKAFDLVFIDYMLVDEDGLDAVRLLAEDPAQTAMAIMIAGEGRMDIAIEAMRLGCSDYLTKSNLSPEALQKSVATALERRFVTFALNEERERRRKLELAVQHYANTCSIEMRTLLAGTLRRVRKLRSHNVSEEHASQLKDLEANIDRLWDSLPDIRNSSIFALEVEIPPGNKRPTLARPH